MAAASPPPMLKYGIRHFRIGGILGVIAGCVAIGLPVLLFGLARYAPGGYFSVATSFVQSASLLVLAGAICGILSFHFYGSSCSHLRRAKLHFWAASVLCTIGTVGLLLVAIAAAFAAYAGSSLVGCAQGSLSDAFSCIESVSPLGAYIIVLGFWISWIGAIGIVLALSLGSGLFQSKFYAIAGVIYAILVVLLAGPLVAIVQPIPDVSLLLLLSPILAILAPTLVVLARPTIPQLLPISTPDQELPPPPR
ncbi:MAG: hypothetical protein ACREBZ_02430 [Thermoplasmata archaeon]